MRTSGTGGPASRPGIADRLPRLWAVWAAARPSQLALIILVYALGVGMATVGPPLTAEESTVTSPGEAVSAAFLEPVLAGAIALLPVAATVHYANEYADVETDALTVRTPFSGGSGALVRTGLSPSFLRTATIGSALIASGVLGAVATFGLALDAIGILVAIFGLGLAYSVPPIALVRRGVGEAVNALLGGLLLPLYGIAVVASPRPPAALAVVPFTLVVACNLFATHWPDRAADAAVGKRTLVVRWTPTRIRYGFAVLATAAVTSAAGLWVGGIFPNAVAIAHAAPIPFLVWGGRVLTRRRSPLPAVLAMVVLATTATVSWWWTGLFA